MPQTSGRRHRPDIALALGLILFVAVLGWLWWTNATATVGLAAALAVIIMFEIIDRTIA